MLREETNSLSIKGKRKKKFWWGGGGGDGREKESFFEGRGGQWIDFNGGRERRLEGGSPWLIRRGSILMEGET